MARTVLFFMPQTRCFFAVFDGGPVEPVLRTEGLGVAAGARVILASVDIQVPERGVTVLLGPVAAGKSTLLAYLAGHLAAHPAFATWGQATYQGAPLGTGAVPALVRQHARLLVSTVRENLLSGVPDRERFSAWEQTRHARELLEQHGMGDLLPNLMDNAALVPLARQRMLCMVRECISRPALLLVDEVTHGLDDAESLPLLQYLREQARDRAVVFATHRQSHARAVADHVVLLAGGRVQEAGDAQRFFQQPSTDVGRHYLRTGSCNVPSADARPEDLAEDAPLPPPLPAEAVRRAVPRRVPSGFAWLRPGKLAGLARPGLLAPLEEDLGGLQDLGIRVLVTLEETRTVPAAELARFGLEGVHFPIVDMGVPSMAAAVAMVRDVEARLGRGQHVAYHCKAGQGRTGTMLAAHLALAGQRGTNALEAARRIHPLWVQSDAQMLFIWALAEAHAGAGPRTSTFPTGTEQREHEH